MLNAMSKEQTDAQIIKGLLDTLVLGVLSESDNYGFGIMEKISTQLKGDGDLLREATLYPLLHRLEEKGLVEAYWRPGDRGTDRKYYRITKVGRSHLEQRVRDWRKVARILKDVVLD
jgi:PadR family transcriptional regulator PadR